MKAKRVLLVALATIPLGLSSIWAQAPVPPPAAQVPLRSAAELESLVAPIALYPDPLIALILPAATQPAEVVLAHRYVRDGKDPNQVDTQPWDSSVKGLVRFPEVLKMMDDNLAWTTDLGQAFLYQEADVMSAIQRLRAKAFALGNLRSTPQQSVITQDNVIEIVPANPQVIYVPVYQPSVVYVQSALAVGPPFITFGVGFGIGLWLSYDFDWWNHRIVVWRSHYPRPAGWWHRPRPRRMLPPPGGERGVRSPYDFPSDRVRVWRPRPRPPISGYQRGDRGWGTRVPMPGPSVRPAPRAPVIAPRPGVGPSAPRVPPARRVPPAPRARPAPRIQPAQPRPVIRPPRTSQGAFIGIRSARETREFSIRGSQSRQTVRQPARGQPPPPRPSSGGRSSKPAPQKGRR